MHFKNVVIAGLNNIDAPHVVTSKELEAPLAANLDRFGMRRNIVEGLTGIKERKFWYSDFNPSTFASQVGELALKEANIPKEKVGVLINCSISKDFIEPSVASLIHNNLKLPSTCMSFDVSNACLGFVNGMLIAANMIESGQIEYALLTSCESAGYINRVAVEEMASSDISEKEFRERFATLTFGSAAVAMVLTTKKIAPDGHQFLGGIFESATEYSHLCVGHNHEIKTDAPGLLVAGLSLLEKTWERAGKVMDWAPEKFSHYIIHQVGRAHTKSFIDAVGIPDEKVFKIFENYGNTGSTTLPLTLFKANEAGEISRGDRIALIGIGSGINCALMEVIW